GVGGGRGDCRRHPRPTHGRRRRSATGLHPAEREGRALPRHLIRGCTSGGPRMADDDDAIERNGDGASGEGSDTPEAGEVTAADDGAGDGAGADAITEEPTGRADGTFESTPIELQ